MYFIWILKFWKKENHIYLTIFYLNGITWQLFYWGRKISENFVKNNIILYYRNWIIFCETVFAFVSFVVLFFWMTRFFLWWCEMMSSTWQLWSCLQILTFLFVHTLYGLCTLFMTTFCTYDCMQFSLIWTPLFRYSSVYFVKIYNTFNRKIGMRFFLQKGKSCKNNETQMIHKMNHFITHCSVNTII